jgi:PilZ domain
VAEHFRRIDPRYDRQLTVELTCAGDEQIARSRNVSLGGIYLEGPKRLPIGAAVTLRFHVPTQAEAIEVGGDVRWVIASPGNTDVGIGVRFQGLRARDVWALNRFFQSVA